MLLHSGLKWELVEELGRKRNIFLVVVVKRQKWGRSFPTGNSGSQSTSCGIRKKPGAVQKRKMEKQNQKINKKELGRNPQSSARPSGWEAGALHGRIKYLLHIYVRIYSRISSSKDSRSRYQIHLEQTNLYTHVFNIEVKHI